MPIKVVDASALGALAFGEPEAGIVADLLESATLVAPSLLWFEMASICRKKIASHPEIRHLLITAFSRARRLPIRITVVNHEEIVSLAEKTGLTTYDATYLWVSTALHGELVTLGRKLKNAAADLGF